MARYNDQSSNHTHWTNRKLMAEVRKYSNLESFSVGHYDGPDVAFTRGWVGQVNDTDPADFARDVSRLYRDSWLNPLLDELERRFVKVRK